MESCKVGNVSFLFLHRKKNGDLLKCKLVILHFLILELSKKSKNIFIEILLDFSKSSKQ